MITPTTITTEEQVYLVGSPINLRFRNINEDTTIRKAVVELFIWDGNLNDPPIEASYTLIGDKVSANDNYINFQISEILASHINKTKFAWIAGDNEPSVSGEVVFWQTKSYITNDNNVEEPSFESLTNIATNGYRYDFEQIGNPLDGQPYNGLLPINYNRNYTDKIKYYKREFDFTKSLGTCTSENIIKSTHIVPTIEKCQLGDKYLVVYINRLGLWDYFTTFGKGVKSIKVSAETNPRLYRNPNNINNNINHSKNRLINQTEQSYVINSGDLHENMIGQVEEVIYSPMLYLIEFNGDTFIDVNVGLTVDSTLVTADSTLFTADNQTVTTQDIGYYSTFTQIPVTCSTESFVRKTRRNDKQKINYDLSFDVTMDRINNLR